MRMIAVKVWVVLLLGALSAVGAFSGPGQIQPRGSRMQGCFSIVLHVNSKETKTNPITKASWYAAEAMGKVFGRDAVTKTEALTLDGFDLSQPPASLNETLARLKGDNERAYFLSGQVDKLIYDPECEFADPFVSFNGRERFVENLANLGSFVTEYSARPISYEMPSETSVETRFMVKLELNLPWKPVLAWPWGVLCEIDPTTNLIKLHKESWDIDAWEGVKQVFRKPTTAI